MYNLVKFQYDTGNYFIIDNGTYTQMILKKFDIDSNVPIKDIECVFVIVQEGKADQAMQELQKNLTRT